MMEQLTSEIHMVVDLGQLEVRDPRPAIAGIWLGAEEFAFPAAGWSDFAVVVLGRWSAALLGLLRNDSRNERMHFMEGPHAVEISLAPFGRFQVRMLSGPGGGREVAVGSADIKLFVSELVAQSRVLLEECKARGWWSRDEETLASHLQDLDREFCDSCEPD